MSTQMSTQLWWHMYGGTFDSKDIWIETITGGSSKHPNDIPKNDSMVLEDLENLGRVELHYLGSFNHEPSHQEKEDLTPERYRG